MNVLGLTNMKHTLKVKLARKLAKRGAKDIFNSKGWRQRREQRLVKELNKQKN